MGVVGETTSARDSEGKKPQKMDRDRDFHLPGLAVPKMCFQTQAAAVRILEASVPPRRRSVERPSAGAGGGERIAQASAPGTEGLRWGGRRLGAEKASGKE